MLTIGRRNFLRGSAAATLALGLPDDLFAQAATPRRPRGNWDAGALRHLLPTVSDSRMLIKASFNAPLAECADAECRRHVGARPHGRYARRALALPCRRSRAGPRLFALAHRCARRSAVRAVGACDLSGARRTAAAVPAADLHLRRRARGPQFLPTATRNRLLRRALRLRRRRSSPTAIRSTGTCSRRSARGCSACIPTP